MITTFPFEEFHQINRLDVFFSCREDNGGFCSNHWHTGLEILYLFEGHMDLYLDNILYSMKKDNLVIINSSVIHSTRCSKDCHTLLLQIPRELLTRYIPEFDKISFHFLLTSVPKQKELILQELKHYLREMAKIYTSIEDPCHFHFTSYLFQFLYLLQYNFSNPISKNPSPNSAKNWNRLEKVIVYVKKHYKEDLTLNEVARVISLNPKYFCKFFKKHMGVTLLEYINTIRLEHIYYDLLHTDYSINELLEKHGFRNYKVFLRMFKKYYGGTPAQKRKHSF